MKNVSIRSVRCQQGRDESSNDFEDLPEKGIRSNLGFNASESPERLGYSSGK